MVFSSVFFIFFFLPVFFAVYYAVPFRAKTYVVLAASYVFYGWWRIDFLGLLFVVTLINYYIGRAIYFSENRRRAKQLLTLAVTFDLGVLFYFKYSLFVTSNIYAVVAPGAPPPSIFTSLILPLGISFYIFEAISYIVDMYKKDAEPADRFVDFASFITLFPHLVAGPVLRYKDLADQFRYRPHSWELFGEGAIRFLLGLAKKVLIADSVAPLADAMFAIPDPTLAEAWLGAVAYTIQLYFDFSGYSSMAVGLGLMMGFRFIENFRYPYIARSITEFWRRWHLSLSAWLRDYLYISLGGNRLGVRRTYINLFLTMFLGGIWHGANWTFVAWGALHGGMLAVERYFGVKPDGRSIVFWPFTTLIVIAGWVLFRAHSIVAAGEMFQGMLGLQGVAIRDAYAWQVSSLAISVLAIGCAVALLEPRLGRIGDIASDVASKVASGQALTGSAHRHEIKSEGINTLVLAGRLRGNMLVSLAATALGLAAIVKLVADSDSPFLYFQF